MTMFDRGNVSLRLHLPRIRPLAACLAMALGVGSIDSSASSIPASLSSLTRVITNCDDSGPGSLRDTIAVSASGDAVDLTKLACSTITLTTGALAIAVDSLTLVGPNATPGITIDGGKSSGHFDRVLNHSGTGQVSVQSVNIVDAKYSGANPAGGCIFSRGQVTLFGATVSNCEVLSTAAGVAVKGGAIYTAGEMDVVFSTVSGNIANSSANAFGGAVFAGRGFFAEYSTISDNAAYASSGYSAEGGGGYLLGTVQIITSTIAGNRAIIGGGLELGPDANHAATILDSTISGNAASSAVGGVTSFMSLSIDNSTIAFNTSAGNGGFPAGVFFNGATLNLQSSIIANNTAGSDLFDLAGSSTISGSHNLITSSPVAPSDTISRCPLLLPLAANGGPTRTHALLHTSPAIDAGSNPQSLRYDQRSLPRVIGAAADIGAFEYQPGGADDEIFKSQFENRCQ